MARSLIVADCMAKIESFRDLTAWQRGMELAVCVYELTRRFPVEERFSLVPQVRRAAASVPANIAEGFNRRARGAYLNHVGIALGSLAEVDTELELAERVGLIRPKARDQVQLLITSAGQLLHGLARGLARSSVD